MDLLLKGKKPICDFIGEDSNRITYLVSEQLLPAYRVGGSGPWRALRPDLEVWLRRQADEHLDDGVREYLGR
jgi:hypothetical protein